MSQNDAKIFERNVLLKNSFREPNEVIQTAKILPRHVWQWVEKCLVCLNLLCSESRSHFVCVPIFTTLVWFALRVLKTTNVFLHWRFLRLAVLSRLLSVVVSIENRIAATNYDSSHKFLNRVVAQMNPWLHLVQETRSSPILHISFHYSMRGGVSCVPQIFYLFSFL